MARRRTAILFCVAAALFAVAAIRDILFPHFFARTAGNPALNAALAVVFTVMGAARSRNGSPSEARHTNH